ncbi:MAG TPA: glycosyltransferase, partial [bacterium]|nr:glycosyltransferase [bacterium]
TVLSLQDFEIFCMQTHLVRRNGRFCEDSDGGRNCAMYCLPRAKRLRVRAAAPLSPIFGEDADTTYLRGVIRNRRTAFSRIDNVLFASEYVLNRYASEGFKTNNSRLIELGIPRFEARMRPDPKPPLRFVFIGNINHEKGVDLLLDVFSGIDEDEAILELHGGSISKDIKPMLEAALRKKGNIKHKGKYNDGDLPEILSGADCVLNPTRRHETFSLVLSEAWMAGAPVIAAASGAVATRVTNGVDGLLFKPGDKRELSSLIRKLIDDPSEIIRLRSGIREVMTIDKYYEEIKKIYTGED